ncbi:uncharacterized protein TrAtP1_010243 [Trichoderma atroviride]|uniref:uncharacterized protein n=1 Tax=Hypocrea atroviridis TaxID=63577 RepID=UPI0033294250|nr:hypothetical protein TrAtP1_010243 [Trichoderma atroviride]
MPPKGSSEEAQQKLEHLRQDLRDVIKKELELDERKKFVSDRIAHWKKELAARKEVEAIADPTGNVNESKFCNALSGALESSNEEMSKGCVQNRE